MWCGTSALDGCLWDRLGRSYTRTLRGDGGEAWITVASSGFLMASSAPLPGLAPLPQLTVCFRIRHPVPPPTAELLSCWSRGTSQMLFLQTLCLRRTGKRAVWAGVGWGQGEGKRVGQELWSRRTLLGTRVSAMVLLSVGHVLLEGREACTKSPSLGKDFLPSWGPPGV